MRFVCEAPTLCSTKDMDRETWLKMRRLGIGSSDVPVLIGKNKWKSELELYLDKAGDLDDEDDDYNEFAYWGNTLEDVVAREFKARFKLHHSINIHVQRDQHIRQHPNRPYMLANLDRVVYQKKFGWMVLECKTAIEYKKKDWEGDTIPDEYLLQVQHQLAVTGLRHAYIAVLVGGNKFYYRHIPRDEKIIEYLYTLEESFWHKVVNRIAPDPDGSKASGEILKTLYPVATDDEIALPYDAEYWINQYQTAHQQGKEAEEKKAEAAHQLQNMLGEKVAGYIGDFRVSWGNVASNRFDTKEFAKQYPDLYKQYFKEGTTRRFGIK
jgi:putative phage-type endonuclease